MPTDSQQSLYSNDLLEIQSDNCKCSKLAKVFNSNSYYYARWYCPCHRQECYYRWYDKAKKLPPGYEDVYSVRTTFLSFPPNYQITDCLEEYWRLLRKQDKNLLYFGRFHFTPNTGLHFHFALATSKAISHNHIRDSWETANITQINQVPPVPTYVSNDYGWLDAVKYALLSNGYENGDWQLPPQGLIRQIVRTSKQFKGIRVF